MRQYRKTCGQPSSTSHTHLGWDHDHCPFAPDSLCWHLVPRRSHIPEWLAADDRVRFAYEAFELLCTSWHLMQAIWLQLHLPSQDAVSSIDDPGIWSLLKIRGLDRLTISGPHHCIASQVRAALKARTRKKNLFPWRPLGMENPGPQDWTASVKCDEDQALWQQQYEWLETRYKYLQDRETITARRTIQRASYRKRQKRLPMLSKRRRFRRQMVVK